MNVFAFSDHTNLDNLIENLKTIGSLDDLPFTFENWKITSTNRNEHDDSSRILEIHNSLQLSVSNEHEIFERLRNISYEDHKRLCIIVNEINFHEKKVKKTRKIIVYVLGSGPLNNNK